MGNYTKKRPKSLVELNEGETILGRQLKLLEAVGIKETIITTGPFSELLEEYVKALKLDMSIEFVYNSNYKTTNYIYSIYLARDLTHDDIFLIHGDLVFDSMVLKKMIADGRSCMAVNPDIELPGKDFKAIVKNGKIICVGVEFFDNAVAVQPIYYLKKADWKIWLDKIISLCETQDINCYAEKALNLVAGNMQLYALDVGSLLCQEVDDEEDLLHVKTLM